MKKVASVFPLLVLLAIGFLMRLWRLNAPLADWHSWRQVDTAGVTREFLVRGIDLLHPRYMDISSVPSGQFNPEGWRMVEFPFVNGMVAILAQTAQSLNLFVDLIVWERLTSIAFSLGSAIFLYLVVKWFSGERVALLTAGVFELLPFSVYYSRVVLPEPKLLFFSLAATYWFIRFIRTGSIAHWFGWVIAGALASLLKPVWLIIFGPALFFYAWIQRRREFYSLRWGFTLCLGAMLLILPFLLWRAWITQFPSGIPASAWLYNAGGIRLRPAWFRWLFADRLGRLILGYWGIFPFVLGMMSKAGKSEKGFFHLWLLGGVLYLAIFASGNVTHDYYQAILVPVIAVFVAKGIDFLLTPPKLFSSLAAYGLLFICLTFMLAFSWFHVRDYFNINRQEIVEAGKAADNILPSQAKVIAPYGGDTAFLYQTNRKGWPVGGAIDDKLSKGATHYVSVLFDEESRWLTSHCQTLLKTSSFVIVDLLRCDEVVSSPSL